MAAAIRRTAEGLTLSLLSRRQCDGDCWRWQGKTNSCGYGEITFLNRRGVRVCAKVHRLAYELWVGPIPQGLVLDHLCRVRECFNPAHLEPVTQAENVLRGRGPTSRYARQIKSTTD